MAAKGTFLGGIMMCKYYRCANMQMCGCADNLICKCTDMHIFKSNFFYFNHLYIHYTFFHLHICIFAHLRIKHRPHFLRPRQNHHLQNHQKTYLHQTSGLPASPVQAYLHQNGWPNCRVYRSFCQIPLSSQQIPA
jgi:hypothetical protein